jgi:hypothetical protein
MKRTLRWAVSAVAVGLTLFVDQTLCQDRYLSGLIWPEPPIITPGVNNSAPSDAVVLFDGKNFDAWKASKGKGKKERKVDPDGGFTVVDLLETKEGFGDMQLHVEFASPKEVKGKDQGRGNNGIGLMGGRYEIQVLDSYDNKTYFEGQAASVYNQRPPMVNASRKPGEWQSYDIIFTTPRWDDAGKLTKPAYVTVLHNGVIVQNHTELKGTTPYNTAPSYNKHADKLPIQLLYHGDPVRFRNIWVREVKELVAKEGGKKTEK